MGGALAKIRGCAQPPAVGNSCTEVLPTLPEHCCEMENIWAFQNNFLFAVSSVSVPLLLIVGFGTSSHHFLILEG